MTDSYEKIEERKKNFLDEFALLCNEYGVELRGKLTGNIWVEVGDDYRDEVLEMEVEG